MSESDCNSCCSLRFGRNPTSSFAKKFTSCCCTLWRSHVPVGPCAWQGMRRTTGSWRTGVAPSDNRTSELRISQVTSNPRSSSTPPPQIAHSSKRSMLTCKHGKCQTVPLGHPGQSQSPCVKVFILVHLFRVYSLQRGLCRASTLILLIGELRLLLLK